MIKKITFIFVCMAAIGANRCMAQSNDSQTITNWGQSIQGVQLAIVMTTNVFSVGSSAVATFVITNSSANTITVTVPVSIVNSDVVLINDTGKIYDLTPHIGAIRMLSAHRQLNPSEEDVESLSVTFGENIEPGDYTLKATRTFTLNEKEYTLESNSIKVTIVK
jgi:hypothetical protein